MTRLAIDENVMLKLVLKLKSYSGTALLKFTGFVAVPK